MTEQCPSVVYVECFFFHYSAAEVKSLNFPSGRYCVVQLYCSRTENKRVWLGVLCVSLLTGSNNMTEEI